MENRENIKGKHILIVDDEELITEMYEQFLDPDECKITICHDGKEALEAFKKTPEEFDFLLTDQSMPFLTGKELIKEVLKIRPNFPVIITTGYNDLYSEEELSESGVCEILMKPIDINILMESINRCLA